MPFLRSRVRIPSPKARSVWSGLTFSALMSLAGTAGAEVTLAEKDGWTFFADGRINTFVSVGFGDGFPEPTPPPVDAMGNPTRQDYTILGADAGWSIKAPPLEDTSDNYFAMRSRSGFMGTIFGFGLKRKLSDTVTAKGYIGVWTTAEAANRDKLQTMSTDVRVGYVSLDGPWGSFVAGRDLGLFGRISTETDFLYGHNFGLGLPCMDNGGNPTCGHVGTGVIGAGFGSGFAYSTPSLAGLTLKVGLYDPVRILGGWDKAPYLRPEAQLAFETPLGDAGMVKFAVEGLWQKLTDIRSEPEPHDVSTDVWGVAGGGRVEIGPARLGLSAWHGKGLGFYTALQNDPVMYDLSVKPGELRTFTGYYGQGALVFGPVQFSLGAGIATVDQLEKDKINPALSTYKSQTGLSAGVFYSLSDNVVIGLDYFRLMMRWYGARNHHFQDPNGLDGDPENDFDVVLDPGVIAEEKLDIDFINAGVTFHW
jgi:hypothetical protein